MFSMFTSLDMQSACRPGTSLVCDVKGRPEEGLTRMIIAPYLSRDEHNLNKSTLANRQ